LSSLVTNYTMMICKGVMLNQGHANNAVMFHKVSTRYHGYDSASYQTVRMTIRLGCHECTLYMYNTGILGTMRSDTLAQCIVDLLKMDAVVWSIKDNNKCRCLDAKRDKMVVVRMMSMIAHLRSAPPKYTMTTSVKAILPGDAALLLGVWSSLSHNT